MSKAKFVEEEEVISIFLVRFHTTGGNVIEKYFPEDIDISGVEFKAIASGFHHISDDIVYFRKGPYFGIAVYKKILLENDSERGARMKAIGVLGRNYENLYLHIPFLKEQILLAEEDKYNYDNLLNYYQASKALEHPKKPLYSSEVPDLHVLSPIGYLNQFTKFFGPSVFVLWKYVLMKKRIMFYCPPPVEASCYRVFCACLLANHSIPDAYDVKSNPLFLVVVNDIDVLDTMESYITCTSDKIFEIKKNLYDLFVDQRTFHSNERYHVLSEPTEVDKNKWIELESKMAFQQDGKNENLVRNYFTDLTTNLFRTLSDISVSDSQEMTPAHFESLGLDYKVDYFFIQEICLAYDLDIKIPPPSSFSSYFCNMCPNDYEILSS